ncbi:IS3 family transposase [Priestia abyssalis]|uniref:IS3 family transposase n=1 Tax=Priestia abyssalis TaxID=1221450 RepID=UPI00111725B5|nr:IS3 family transposase [Priestia abyssalis]
MLFNLNSYPSLSNPAAFHSCADAYHEVAEYMDFYNNRRIHSSILDFAPNEFYQRNQTEELTIKEVRV